MNHIEFHILQETLRTYDNNACWTDVADYFIEITSYVNVRAGEFAKTN
jgi:hypothetical protein